MARRPRSLTNTEILKAKKKDKLYRLYDGDGLCLKITSAGNKIWEYRFKNPDTKKSDTIIIGDFPLTTLAEAREKHSELRKLVMSKQNPKTIHSGVNFIEAFHNWHDKWKEEVAEKTAKEAFHLISTYAFRMIGNMQIDNIETKDIDRVLMKVERSGNLSSLQRVKSYFSRVFQNAAKKGQVKYDPTHLISLSSYKKHVTKNHRSLSIYEIYKLVNYFKHSTAQGVTKRALELIFRNIARAQEVTNLEWDYVNENRGYFDLPASIIKTKKEHIVPLTRQTRNILKLQQNDSNFIFSTNSIDGHISRKTLLKTLATNNIDSSLHGIRHLASTVLNEASSNYRRMFDSDAIEMALAHSDKNNVRETYNKAEYLPQRRIMIQWWSDFIDLCTSRENNALALIWAGIDDAHPENNLNVPLLDIFPLPDGFDTTEKLWLSFKVISSKEVITFNDVIVEFDNLNKPQLLNIITENIKGLSSLEDAKISDINLHKEMKDSIHEFSIMNECFIDENGFVFEAPNPTSGKIIRFA